MSEITAPLTSALPMSACTAGTSSNPPQIQNAISGVSNMAISEACPDGSGRSQDGFFGRDTSSIILPSSSSGIAALAWA